MRKRSTNEPVQATAAAPLIFGGLADSLLLGFVLAQSPAAMPDFLRWMQSVVKKSVLIFFAALLPALALSAGGTIDLSKIDHFCPKGRVQDKDYNRHLPVIDALIEQGTNSIPLLIGMLDDPTEIDHQIVDYWPLITVGDTALIILTDLTTDSSWRSSTIPGASWDEILGSRPNTNILIPVYCQLRDFKDKHGSKEIQRRWQKIWQEHQGQIYWDAKERCFKLRASKRASNKRSALDARTALCLRFQAHGPGASESERLIWLIRSQGAKEVFSSMFFRSERAPRAARR